MDDLNQYLQGDFLTDLEVLHKVREKADAALETLARFRKGAEFPYELCQGEPWKTVPSHSTAAMILFSMGVAVGRITSSPLVPSVTMRNQSEMPPNIRTLHRDVSDALKGILLELLQSMDRLRLERKKRRDPSRRFEVCWSSTYGPDDPFTLVWLFELLFAYRDDDAIQPFYQTAKRVADARVKAVFESTKPAREALTNEHNLEHLFPLLRTIQLHSQLLRDPEYEKDGLSSSLLAHYLQNRLHLHLSYFDIRYSSYDAAELTFAMEAILLLDPNALDAATLDRCHHVLLESQQ